jgi:mannosyltransferase PIG-V
MNYKDTIKELLPVIIITIVGTYLFSYVSYLLIQDMYPDSLLEIWTSWDTRHYIRIAEYGYGTSGDANNNLIAFFPLYPYLTKVFTLVFQSYMLSALIISNLAYAVAAYFLYELVKLDYEEEDAYRAVIYFSVFPTAYFLHAAYTESLFLALSIGSFYFARKKMWALASVLGMLSAATRITGIILLPVLIVEYLSQKEYKLRDIKINFLWIWIIGLGLVSYLILNYMVDGDPFYFLGVQQESWSRKLALPYEGFLNAVRGLPGRSPSGAFAGDWAEIIFAVLGLAGVIYSFFRLRISYSLYVLLTWLLVTSSVIWLSIPRFTLTMFPLIILMALFGRRRGVNFTIIFLSLICYALFLSQFVRFRWAF